MLGKTVLCPKCQAKLAIQSQKGKTTAIFFEPKRDGIRAEAAKSKPLKPPPVPVAEEETVYEEDWSVLLDSKQSRRFWRDFLYAQAKGCLLLIAIVMGLILLAVIWHQFYTFNAMPVH